MKGVCITVKSALGCPARVVNVRRGRLSERAKGDSFLIFFISNPSGLRAQVDLRTGKYSRQDRGQTEAGG